MGLVSSCEAGLCDDGQELRIKKKGVVAALIEEEPPDPPLAGRWMSGRGNLHIVGVDAVQWRSGDVTRLKKRRRKGGGTEYLTELNGTNYTAYLTEEGKLQWSDGDVWTRDMRAPETGTYSAVTGALTLAVESAPGVMTQALHTAPTVFSHAIQAAPGVLVRASESFHGALIAPIVASATSLAIKETPVSEAPEEDERPAPQHEDTRMSGQYKENIGMSPLPRYREEAQAFDGFSTAASTPIVKVPSGRSVGIARGYASEGAGRPTPEYAVGSGPWLDTSGTATGNPYVNSNWAKQTPPQHFPQSPQSQQQQHYMPGSPRSLQGTLYAAPPLPGYSAAPLVPEAAPPGGPRPKRRVAPAFSANR